MTELDSQTINRAIELAVQAGRLGNPSRKWDEPDDIDAYLAEYGPGGSSNEPIEMWETVPDACLRFLSRFYSMAEDADDGEMLEDLYHLEYDCRMHAAWSEHDAYCDWLAGDGEDDEDDLGYSQPDWEKLYGPILPNP